MSNTALVARGGPPGPLRWGRAFRGTPEHVRLARAFVRHLLGDTPIVSDAALAVSEMAANAIRHSRTGQVGGTFTVQVHRWDRGATVAVTDNGDRLLLITDDPPRTPARTPTGPALSADGLAEGGRGLLIVRAVARSLHRHGNARGRTFIAEFSW